MIVINTSGKAQATNKHSSAPIVQVLSKGERIVSKNEQPTSEVARTKPTSEPKTDPLLESLTAELREVKVERDKLSRQIALMVRKHKNGTLPISDLEKHYEAIEKLTRAGSDVYQRLEHYQKHGELPTSNVNVDPLETGDRLVLIELKRSLENRRSKLKVKIDKYYSQKVKPKDPTKILTWEALKIELDERYTKLIQKLKALDNE